MGKRWRIRPLDLGEADQLARVANIPTVVAQLLVHRGIDRIDDVRSFIDARLSLIRSPDSLPGITSAADCIHAAVQSGKKITIYGDYDADGMTGTAILLRCLRLMGADVDFYVPQRLKEGYGLNVSAMKALADRGTNLVVSVDCGITSVEPVDAGRALGLQFVITDHHQCGAELPAAEAIVHPGLPGSEYPFSGLCGAGVALKLAWALCQRDSGSERVTLRYKNFLMSAMGIAAIGTVADVVPLIDENRLIVRHGLNAMKQHPVAGIQALIDATSLKGRSRLTSEDIAFTMAPRLNAAGRLGAGGAWHRITVDRFDGPRGRFGQFLRRAQ